jgi:hypothetical protein
MTKKSKRKIAAVSPAVNGATPRMAEEKAFISSRIMTDADFNPDYTSIKKDLKRIGILAVSFFAVLVILSFFL